MDIKKIIRREQKKLSDFLYHKSIKKKTSVFLKNIEETHGKTNAKHIKLSNEYAMDVLGSRKYAPWLYVYSAYNSSFKEGWIPENYYFRIVTPKIQGDYGEISQIKPLSKLLYQSNLFPDTAYYVNGLFFNVNREVINKEALKEHLFNEFDKVVFKADNSAEGKGVIVFSQKSFDIQKVYAKGNGVFQKYIRQHSFFDQYMPNSVATIRFTTIIDDNGNSKLRACFLRIGMNSDTHVKADSNIRVPINMENGELCEVGSSPNWKPIFKHPETKSTFGGNKIPCFDECKNLALSLHERMPYSRCVGWDMIVNENNEVELIECQGINNSITIAEATQGPCFSDLGWENLWKK